MSFFKSIWKNNSKHKKLSEEQALKNAKEVEVPEAETPEPEKDCMSFKLKYLGNTVVDKSVGENVSRDAIKNIIKVAKASGKKIARVNVEISMKGISVSDSKGNLMFEISIYRISNCSTDKSHRQIFSFFSTDENETMECHAFLCPKRKVAEVMALTVAHTFTNAYEQWKTSPSAVENGTKDEEMKNTLNTMKTQIIESDLMMKNDVDEIIEEKLIDFDTELIPNVEISKNDWVGFDDDFGRNFEDFEADFDNMQKPQQNNVFWEVTNKYDVFRTSFPVNDANKMDFAAFS